MICETQIVYTTSVDDAGEYTGRMARLPVVNQPAHHPGALLHHLARRTWLRTEAVLAAAGPAAAPPGGARPRTGGGTWSRSPTPARSSSRRPSARCQPSRTRCCALDDSQRETLYSLLQQLTAGTAVSCTEAIDD